MPRLVYSVRPRDCIASIAPRGEGEPSWLRRRGAVGLRTTIVVVLFAAGPARAAADDAQAEADALIRHGVELRRAHADDAAVREFLKAYALVHTPRAVGQLGLAEQALGRWEDAERHLGESLASVNDPWVSKNRAVLYEARGTIAAHLGRIEVIGEPEGAEVTVNGQRVGKLPLTDPVHVSAGEVDIELRAPGYIGAQRMLTLVGGQYQRLVIRLAKENAPPVVEKIAAPPPTSSPHPAPAVAGAATSDSSPSQTHAVLKWSAAGLAAAGLVTGAVATVLEKQGVSDFKSSKCAIDDGKGVDNVTGMYSSACDSKLRGYQMDTIIAIAGYAAAGAFAMAWVVLDLTEPRRATVPTGEQAARWPICSPSPAGVGVSCLLRF